MGTIFILAITVACISWTATKEEVFKEIRAFCVNKSHSCTKIYQRKFFYLFTCEYCFSHYVTILILLITKQQLLYTDWRGFFLAGFSIVWVANIYMSLYNLLRIDLKKQKLITQKEETELATKEKSIN